MQIERICKEHPEYNDLIFKYELKELEKARLITKIIDLYDSKYTSDKNDGNCWIVYWLGLTTQKPVDKFSLVTYKSARVSIPDCDLDFEDDKRQLVMDYITQKYGEDYTCQVVTFGHMKARASVRDVGRALGIPLHNVDIIAKSIKNTPGKPIDLTNSLDKSSEYYSEDFDKLVSEDDNAKDIYKFALPLENTIRQTGIHAAAMLIGDVPLSDRIPLMTSKRAKTKYVSQLDYPTSESIGMLKVDLLGLITLRIIRQVTKLIHERHGILYNINNIQYEDKSSYEILQNGNTIGIFQVENSGLTRYLTQMKPTNFGHIADMISLYRPGPIGYIPSYIYRLHGKEEITYKHALLEEITHDTQGIMIYQEQVNQVLMRLGGYHAGDADKVRKNISKKNVAEIEKNRKIFVNGCKNANKIDEEIAQSIYDDINEFALYGFNRCVSGSTVIKRNTNQSKSLSVEEMFKVKESLNFAHSIGSENLHYKYRQHGYGYGLSLCDDGRIRKNKIVDIRYVGMRQTYKLVTQSGKEIVCTNNHKFPTPNGTKRLDQLLIGDELYVIGAYEKTKTSYNLYSENCTHSVNRYELHHKDFDRTNNSTDNLQWLCISCHKKVHYANGRTKVYQKGILSTTEKIISISPYNVEPVYDVEMDAPNHNFVVSNGIVTSNSHAASYARITLITAWLKANYPLEFATACLICEGEDNGKRVKYIQDAIRNGIKVLPPQIGGTVDFSIKDKDIVYGLKSIDGVGESIAKQISNSTPDSVFELKLKKDQMTRMIQAGCFDVLGNRPQLLAGIDLLSEYSKRTFKWKSIGQRLMFEPEMPKITKTISDYEVAMMEYEALGAWLVFHPLSGIKTSIKNSVSRTNDVETSGNLILVVTKLEQLTTRKGKKMFKFIGTDEYGSIEVIVGAKNADRLTLKNGDIVHVSISIDDDDKVGFVNSIMVIKHD